MGPSEMDASGSILMGTLLIPYAFSVPAPIIWVGKDKEKKRRGKDTAMLDYWRQNGRGWKIIG